MKLNSSKINRIDAILQEYQIKHEDKSQITSLYRKFEEMANSK